MSLSGTKTPSKPSKTKGGPVKSGKQECPEIKYLLADFVEVVTQDEEKWVKGAAKDLTDTSVIKNNIERKDKDKNGNFKQFINIKKDVEGKDKRHPEYGRKIIFKARIKREDGKKEKLAGVLVKFSFKEIKADTRQNPDADLWKDANLTGSQRPGLGSKNGANATTLRTNDKGWTKEISFYTSAYGGDKYNVSAELHPTVKTSKRRPPKKSKNYIVWRKFWYQMTYADGYGAKEPKQTAKAFEEIFVEMIKTAEQKFKKEDFSEDLRKRTFYEKYQFKLKAGNATVVNIGTGNIKAFGTKIQGGKTVPKHANLGLDPEKKHPVKENLIVCEYQCDPKGRTSTSVHEIKSNGAEVTLSAADKENLVVTKPALKANSKLVVTGKWRKKGSTWSRGGKIVDQCIEISSARDSLLTIKVDLSKGATKNPPIPTEAKPIKIKLKLEAGKGYAGWAPAEGIVAVFRPDAGANEGGTETNYNDTVAHEFGHKFNQTPLSARKPSSMKKHPLQYQYHSGSGSHCRHNPTHYYMNKKWRTSDKPVEFKTKIKKKAASATATHEVVSTENFKSVIGRKLLVNGVRRKLKAVKAGNKLEFTQRFRASKDWVVEHKVNWQKNEKEPRPYGGDCIMFHQSSNTCAHKFCDKCKPYLQLQDMSSM